MPDSGPVEEQVPELARLETSQFRNLNLDDPSGAPILCEGQPDLLTPSIEEAHVAQRIIPAHGRRLALSDVRGHHVCLIGEEVAIWRHDDLLGLAVAI